MNLKTIPFTPRCQELLAIEGNYDGIVLSCRHRDILRASITPHFSSCFSPKKVYIQPIVYCYRAEVCIIFKRDRAGFFIGRVFGFWIDNKLNLAWVYGNNLTAHDIRTKILTRHPEVRIVETHKDVYFPVH